MTAAALRRIPGVLSAELDYRAGPADAPNDPDLPLQWGLPAIGAPTAWAVVTGSAAITIAVLDTGIALTHPDLVDKLWANPGEIPANGLDDDGNGKVDDVHGWHFFHDASFNPGQDAAIQDDNGHGTHVAGIAAAATNNGAGIAGISWGSPLMTVKVMDQFGTAWYSDIAAGMVYAADQGARVVNLSLGGAAPSDVLCAAAEYARQRGSLPVAASGNTGGPVLYPAACAAVLAVGASDSEGRTADFSNRGPEMDLLAPGIDIYSTWYASGTGANTYRLETGTSMAAPFVSGAAALVWSRWPEWDSAAVAEQITSTAVMRGISCWRLDNGWGVLDAAAAVSAPATAPRTSPWCLFFPWLIR